MLKYLVLSTSGVLTPTLENLVIDAVAARQDIAKDLHFQHWVHECCREYRRGEISSIELSNRIVEQSGLKIDPEEFGDYHPDHSYLDNDVLEILELIRDRFEFIFFSDLPEHWFGDQIQEKAFQSSFGVAQVLIQEKIQKNDTPSSQLDLVLAAINKPLDQLLLIDRRNHVTTQAVRRGVHAILFVNPFRLQQELTLRKLL